ncbi:hypothetical protein PFFCH_01767 [Plasmodium falciparum FCH/4]|uniref:Duffy-binding-like domain-containing protein n=1 Tax=Plasmodium falciparum FCH/4 TaxID=1036724 RepID=A0A024VSD5_PLAFA|nr:hypothetical protein PFFCH_01767 [Plasmodium falciparum FCH/4]
MGPPEGGHRSGAGSVDKDGIDHQSAKRLLDSIGKKVHDLVKKEADDKNYTSELHGDLSQASIFGVESGSTTDTCTLVEQYYKHTNGDGKGKRYPCTELSGNVGENPFSDTLGGQCTDSKMRSGGKGACAPYRRLHLCSHNLESIDTTSTTSDNAKHKLLLEVCMAAKYEGDLIKTHHGQHQNKYGDSASQLCTVLARSFADIGDIVRGKDLFLGNTYESAQRKQLDDKLKDIFKKIHGGLTTNGAQNYYKDDAKKKNFYQLREDWWTANRSTVWKAITCGHPDGTYFRDACSGGKNPTHKKCTCANGDVPTYFDYVPQYLRWFEEWAEDFCRKRKHKLQNAITNCRGDSGKPKYCDLNRYDCTQTASGKHDFFEEDNCIGCHFSCSHFVNWIDNQKLEFLKQKEKYGTEITRGASGKSPKRTKRGARASDDNGYESKFYKILKEKNKYGTVNDFLELLNKEDVCTKFSEDEGTINFKNVNSGSAKKGDDSNKTFYRTKYCEACPWCGVQEAEGGKGWKAKEETCGEGMGYEGYNDTKIPKLTPDKEKSNILDKYKTFCSTGDSQIKKWQCYYKKKNESDVGKKDINFCVLQDGKQHTKDRKDKSYNAFFWDWVHDMLIDSMQWRDEHGKCINDAKSGKCRKGCKNPCDCFQKWVVQKKTEWGQIKVHFGKQDFGSRGEILGPLMKCPDFVLQEVLKKNLLLEIIEGTYGKSKETEHIREMLQQAGVGDLAALGGTCTEGGVAEQNTTIDKLLNHEEGIATKCQKDCQEPQQSLGRSLKPRVVDDDDSPKKRDTRTNPCYSDTTTEYAVLAEKVAETLQGKAQTQLDGKDGGRNALKGNPSQGHYNGNGNVKNLNGEICSIDEKYSNASSNKSNNPCDGKGDRLKIETQWKDAMEKNKEIKLYLPPRREHMCTSNVEHLLPHKGGRFKKVPNDKATHSLLGDVLIAAKKEGEDIKTKLTKNHNRSSICRTMKYSFADIGDIIRGRDMWENGEAKQLQNDLETIFGHIHSSVNGKGKYAGDENKTPPYKQLREDWWSANRSQVWKAMICETPSGKNPCSGTDVPLDDYIPQRLRWMTEWAEWFCKMQSQEYENLFTQCMTCKNNRTKCTSSDPKCTKCTQACIAYRDKIKTWAEQWQQMELKYLMLYWQAENGSARMAFRDASPDYQQMVDFLQQLVPPKSGTPTTTPYSTAPGYIHLLLLLTKVLPGIVEDRGVQHTNTIFLTPHEYKDACKCNENKASSPEELGRSDSFDDNQIPSVQEEEEDDNSDTDSDSDSEEQEEEEEKEEDTEGTEATEEPPLPPAQDTVDVCNTVKSALEDTASLNAACSQKYAKNNSRLGWKCVPSDTNDVATSENSAPRRARSAEGATTGGSICIPPRRRRLYVTPLTKWADKVGGTTQVEGQDTGSEGSSESGVANASASSTSTTSSSQLLRQAFIESAAVETFFLWHRYKKIKDKEYIEKEKANENVIDTSEVGKELQKKLEEGKIDDEFKRQMFYTLGDYRDIVVLGSNDVTSGSNNNNIVLEASNDKEKMKQLQTKIQAHINSGPPSLSGQKTPQQTWWEKHGKDIWEGMLCALTYKETGTRGQASITQIENANGGKNLFEKLKNANDYNSVKLDNSGDGPKLTEFVKRPTYFRWLEEWGEEFCHKQKHKLYIIEKECRGKYPGEKYCSGDGLRCDEKVPDNKDIFKDFNCPSCANSCRWYKRWISRKKIEFDEQKKAYGDQKEKAESNNGATNNKEFLENLKKHGSIDLFLKKLKDGPCKNDSEEGKKGGDILNFTNPEETFKHTEYCDPCSKFKFKCENCKSSGDTKVTCNGKNETVIRATDIKDDKNGNENINMLVSDNSTKEFKGEGLKDACGGAGIFEGIREDVWECGEHCGVHVCTLKKNVNNGKDEKHIIMKEFVKRWLEYFFEDYNKINKKLKICIENGEEPKSENKCEQKCNCVKKWLQEKRTEWDKINATYLKKYTENNGDDGNNLSSFLEDGPFKNEVDKAIKPCQDLEAFEKSKKCTETDSSENEKDKGSNKKDGVVCLLENLGEKAEKCKTQTSGSDCTPSTENPSSTLPDDEEPLEEEENQVKPPEICKDVIKAPTEPVVESGCVPAKTKPEETSPPAPSEEQTNQTSKPEQTPILKPEEEAPAPTSTPSPRPRIPRRAEDPLKTALMTSTLPLGIALALGSIAFLFLKWNTLKDEFISNMLQNEPNTEPNILRDNVDNNTHPTTSRHNVEEKPFITSIHDRDLYTGEEYNYDMSTNSGNNDLYNGKNNLYSGENNVYGGIDPTSDNRGPYSDKNDRISDNHHPYSGIDLINDTLSGNQHIDIYDEVLKRKENELFGTNHPKQTNTHNVAKLTNSDPIHNQLELFHKWLDRHRDMCEQWENHHERLAKLKEEWENETHSGNTHPSDSNKTLNTNVSIQIHMDNPKPINEFSNMDTYPNNSSMDTILEDLDKPFNEPYYYDMYDDDMYYDVNDHDTSTVDSNAMDVPSKVQIEMDVNTKLVKEKYPIADVWDI